MLEEFKNGVRATVLGILWFRLNLFTLSQDGVASFVSRVEDITRKKIHYDSKLLFGPEATTQRELLQELDRYTIPKCSSYRSLY